MGRTAFILKVKADRLEEYKLRHKTVWPDMLDALRATGWKNYSLFLRPDGLLVGYVEIEDFDGSRAAMSELEVNDRWQNEMSAFFEDIDGAAPDSAMVQLEEVFHLDRYRRDRMPNMTIVTKIQSFLVLGLGLFALAAAGCGKTQTSSAPAPIRIGVIPYESASAIQEQYGPWADYVGAKLHRKATVVVAQDYIGIVQALQSDQIEAAYLNPLSYVLFDDKMKNTPEHLIPISMPWVHGSLYYYGVIFTLKGNGINSVTDLKGKNIAFVDPTSTSGYLYPYQYLKQHGIDPDKDFKNKFFASANGVVPAVLNGSADAGAIFSEGLELSTKGSPGDFNKLKVLATVGPIANGMLVARGNLDPAEVAQLKQALIDINTDPAGKSALKELQVTKWEPADDSVFDPVRQAASALGLNIQSLHKKK